MSTKKVAIIGLGIALYVAISMLLKIPIGIGHLALDLGYIVLAVYCYLYGATIGAIVGACGCTLVSLLASGMFPLGWLLGNAFIGCACGRALSQQLEDLLRQYYFVGGMPEVVDYYLKTQDLNGTRAIQKRIIKNYRADFSKHRSVGDSRRPLYFLIAAGILNVILNFLLVAGFKLSVAGVAIATTISNALAAGLVLRTLMYSTDHCHLKLKQLKIDWSLLKEILWVGIPAGINSSFFNVAHMLLRFLPPLPLQR